MSNKNDNVYHPKHYEIPGLPVESIVIIRAVLGEEGFKKFCRGNALKYLIRADNKGGVEDLKKARVYLGWEIGDTAEHVDITEAAKSITDYCYSMQNCIDCDLYDEQDCACTLGGQPDMWVVKEKKRLHNDIDGDES